MKKVFLKKKIILSIVLVFLGMMGMGQNLPPDSNQWHISELSSPDAIFPVVQQRANAYFALHPEMDSLNPLEKMAFKRWEDFWRNRASINSSSQPGMLKDVLEAMNDNSLLSNQQDLTAITLPSKWMLISPDNHKTQNLGTVTAIWSHPVDKNFILLGTETSGLWKTTDGGLNWVNISDSYNINNSTYMAAAGFGVSSIAVDYNSSTNQINAVYITTYLPNTDLYLGHGATILKSTDIGVSWSELPAYNSYIQANSGTYYQNMAWKIIFFQNNLYAAIGKRLVVFNTTTTAYNTLFELGVNSPNPLNPVCLSIQAQQLLNYNTCRKIRDFEIFQSGSGYQICLTTDGLEISAIKANAEVYHCLHNNPTPFSGIFSWSNFNLTHSIGNFIDNAAVETYNNEFYLAYDEKLNGTNANFRIDKITPTLALNNIITKVHNFYTQYPEESVFTPPNEGFFNGFGYRYDAFKVINNNIMYVGGFNVTKIDLTANPVFASMNNSNNEIGQVHYNFNKSETCHNGIRTIIYYGFINNHDEILVGNEGGISTSRANIDFTNINGKGLAINQFATLTTTQNNNRDVIVASAIRNGLWHYEQGTNNNEWRQFYWEDGGSSLVNENNPSTMYNCTSWWDASAPGYAAHLSPGTFSNTTNGLSYVNAPIANQALVCPSLTPQEEIQGISGYYPPIEAGSASNGVYLGKHDLWYSGSNGNTGTWTQISNFLGGTNSNFSRNIQAFEVTNNLVCGNRIYLAFADPTWGLNDQGNTPGTLPQRKLWRRTGSVWQDITQNVIPNGNYTLSYNGITDIAVNPTNSCELWITLNQFCVNSNPAEGLERVLHSTDGGNNWTDYSQGLNPAPVNTIKYFYESVSGKRLLFIGTDVGVFYRDPENNNSVWKPLNGPTHSLPRCIVTDLEISYRTNKIRAATLGRGIWETDILCLNGTPEYTTLNTTSPANTLWNTNKYSSGIYIGAGKTLTITSNVRLIPFSTVFIEAGGRLILDGGVLEACPDEMWNGVYINGIPETNPNLFYDANHSIIELKNNATIKDAIIGIENVGSGIIYMNGANFINNQRAIVMNESSGNIIIDKSYFKNGNFICNQLYHDATTYPFQHFIELNNSYKLRISGCKFENKLPVANPYQNTNGIGIKSYHSVYTVCDECNNPNPMQQGDPCPAQYTSKSVFTNLNYGIFATNSVKTRNITVKNTIFDNNYRGIYTTNMNNASFTSNTFKIPAVALQPYNQVSYDGAYGLYLMGCSGYTIESNLFDKTNNAQWASVGMIINNSGSALNSIYNNTFKNIRYVATLAQNDNKGTNYDTGLKIKCNDYINNRQDIAVVHSQSGISIHQGANVSNPSEPDKDKKPAGNRFSKIITTGTPDFDNDMGQIIKYFYHNDLNNPNNLWVPQYCSSSAFILKSEVPLSTFNKAQSCPAIATATSNIQPNYLPNLMLDLAQNTLDYNSAKLILQIWVDGGNTPELVQTTELAYPWEAYTLYNELMGLSPYLSDEVLIAAIQNEDGLPPLMLKLILLANPQAVRSAEVMDALYARNNPFPEEWILELEEGLEKISPREELEADVSYYASERKTYLDLLKQYYLADTSASAMQNLQQLLSAESDFESRYELVFAKIANNEYTAANTLLENMEAVLPEDEAEINRYYKMRELIPFVIQLYSGSTEWENIDQSRINEISESEGEDLPASIARAIRLQFDESYTYAEPIYVNESLESKSTSATKINRNKAIDNKQSLKISPNPANDFIIAEYKIDKTAKEVLLLISDMQGRLQMKKQLSTISNQALIDIRNLQNGSYNCTIIVDGQQKAVTKLIVQH